MARGWESKSVELQMENSKTEQKEPGNKQPLPEVADVLRRKETLLLARTYLQQQMQKTQHERHRDMLQNALVDVEKQIADLGVPGRVARPS